MFTSISVASSLKHYTRSILQSHRFLSLSHLLLGNHRRIDRAQTRNGVVVDDFVGCGLKKGGEIREPIAVSCILLPLVVSFSKMATYATAEICDANQTLLTKGDVRVLQPIFQMYGHCRAFSGPIVTLKVFEDNVLVREMLESPGDGRVLVIDGGGSQRCALVGGNLGQLAQNMGWAGILVNGCIRDVDEINACDVGIRALGSHPLKSNKKGVGEKHVLVNIGGTIIHDGEWLYADSDGILISKSELSL